jgi:NADPH:quinone reductase-like Zn-dependent oxidoreductase
MRASVFHAPNDIRIETVADSQIHKPTDAIVRITHACICGSDLWFYRGTQKFEPGWRTGHEWMGIVEEVGSEVTTVKKGDRVLYQIRFVKPSILPSPPAPLPSLGEGSQSWRRRRGEGDRILLVIRSLWVYVE